MPDALDDGLTGSRLGDTLRVSTEEDLVLGGRSVFVDVVGFRSERALVNEDMVGGL